VDPSRCPPLTYKPAAPATFISSDLIVCQRSADQYPAREYAAAATGRRACCWTTQSLSGQVLVIEKWRPPLALPALPARDRQAGDADLAGRTVGIVPIWKTRVALLPR